MIHSVTPTPWPSIDVVIPTYNCRENLNRCLQSVRNQLYEGRIEIVVVDGGSRDGSPELAQRFGARVFINPGQYGTGLSGARHFGEQIGTSELVWVIDSDNFLVGDQVARRLAAPFLDFKDISLAVPETAVEPSGARFNNWLALDEIRELREAIANCEKIGSLWVTDQLTYGLTNATLIRRSALEAAGGYDSDIKLLERLRGMGLARAAIVPEATFYHNQTTGVFDYWAKWRRRVLRYASLSEEALNAHFIPSPSKARGRGMGLRPFLRRMTRSTRGAVAGFMETGDTTWLAGLTFPLILILIALRHPRATNRTLKRVL